jgi:drug/metabolite transporter (DMT)-like permease
MSRRAVDVRALVAGLAIGAFGVLLLLDSLDAVNLTFAYLSPVVLAMLGAILVAGGLSRARRVTDRAPADAPENPGSGAAPTRPGPPA